MHVVVSTHHIMRWVQINISTFEMSIAHCKCSVIDIILCFMSWISSLMQYIGWAYLSTSWRNPRPLHRNGSLILKCGSIFHSDSCLCQSWMPKIMNIGIIYWIKLSCVPRQREWVYGRFLCRIWFVWLICMACKNDLWKLLKIFRIDRKWAHSLCNRIQRALRDWSIKLRWISKIFGLSPRRVL